MKGRNTVKGNEKTQASRERTCDLVSTCRVCPTQRGKKAKGKTIKSQISPQRAARDKQEEIDREKEHHSIVPLLRLMKSTGGGIFFVSFGAFLASASKQASKQKCSEFFFFFFFVVVVKFTALLLLLLKSEGQSMLC